MKRPTWATIVGVLAIIFGGFGMLGGAQEMSMPYMLEMQKEMMQIFKEGKTPDGEPVPKMKWEIEKDGKQETIEMSQMFDAMQEHMEFPEWYKSWSPTIGFISILVSGLYFISGIFLLMVKPFAVRIFKIAIGVSIVWAVIQGALFAQSGSTIFMLQMLSSIVSAVIDVIFLIVVFVGSKGAFMVEKENDLTKA